MSTTIAFDIEVAGFLWEEVDEITRGYLLQRAKDEAQRESVPERTALFPGLGKIVAIGLWNLEQDRGLMLLEGGEEAEHEWERLKANDSLECRNCHNFEYMDFTAQGKRASTQHSTSLASGEKTCIDCHKGIAHRLPDMRGVEGWE